MTALPNKKKKILLLIHIFNYTVCLYHMMLVVSFLYFSELGKKAQNYMLILKLLRKKRENIAN